MLSHQDDDGLQTVQDAKVIIDTGATESVAGVTCMARLLDRIKSNYKVCLSDRPKFKFGNGMVQQATSRVDIFTKALGDVSFYLLDGTAEFTPPLLGGKELWYRQALVAYGGEYLVHRSKNGKWWLNRLTALRGKHIALDMNEKSEPLDEAIQRMRNGPSEEEPDEEEDEEEDDGMSGGPSPRGPPDGDGRPGGGDGHGDDHDGQDPVRQMVEATAASVTGPARSREARTAETRDAAVPTASEALDETPLDPPGTHAPLCGHPECRGRVLCRDLPLFDGRARSEKSKGRFGDSRGGTAEETERSRSKSRDGSRMRHENREEDGRDPGGGSTGSTGAVFMMSSQCTSSWWHGSGAWHDGREPLRDRLASLAQRLRGLKTRIDDDQCPGSEDPRHTGWPCSGAHVAGRPKSNQWATWTACKRCGVRLSYVAKRGMVGEYRSLGSQVALVQVAQVELQREFTSAEMTDKIFQGKIMEVKGREIVATRGQAARETEIRANTRQGQAIVENQTMGYVIPKSKPKSKPKAAPTTLRRPTTRAVSPTPSTTAPGTPRTSPASPSTTVVEIVEAVVAVEQAEIIEDELDLTEFAMVIPEVEEQE